MTWKSWKLSKPCVYKNPALFCQVNEGQLSRAESDRARTARGGSKTDRGGRGASNGRDRAAAVGEGGEPPAGRVRGHVGGRGAAAGVQLADQDGALRPKEGRLQGSTGPLGADRGNRGGVGVPRGPARQSTVPGPLRRLRRRRLPASQQSDGVRLLLPRQGVRVPGVRDDGGGAAGVHGGAGRRGGAAVEQALQHLHAVLRADRRRHALQPARRRRHGRALRLLRARALPRPLILRPGGARISTIKLVWVCVLQGTRRGRY